jgi:hypothetical protein
VNFIRDVAANTRTAAQFVQALAVLIPETTIGSLPGLGLTWWNASPVFLNTGQASGYLQQYQNTFADHPELGDILGNGDQGHHFIAFLEYGFLHGGTIANLVAYLYEVGQAAGNGGQLNQGDIRLGQIAASIGAGLRNGTLAPGDIILDVSALCKH